MKLLPLNSHSIIEEDYEKKLLVFVDYVTSAQVDVIALQEVNQSASGTVLDKNELYNFIEADDKIAVKADNHAYRIVKLLRERGANYYWTYLPIKNGYERFDEGTAIISRLPIDEIDTARVSSSCDYYNWRTRKILGAKIAGEWYYSVHLGWWKDENESFEMQWDNLTAHIADKEKVWLMGDFNNPAEIRNEGYDLIKMSGWYDCYELADTRNGQFTARKNIAGWKERSSSSEGIRIDFIFTNTVHRIENCKVVFDDRKYPVVSDHYGVMITKGS